MDKFLEYVRQRRVPYRVHGSTITVLGDLGVNDYYDAISIPNNVTVAGILRISSFLANQLPENLRADVLEIECTSTTHLPESLYVRRSLCINESLIENIAYREHCGAKNRTIFACYINGNKFTVCAGCFLGTLDEFDNEVDQKYYGADATRYKNQARECVIELAEKLGKPIPQDVFS